MQSPDHSFPRQKQGQGFGIPKALKKLFREPGPLRTTDVRGRNASFDISNPNLTYPLPPTQQFHQSNYSSPFDYGNQQTEYYDTKHAIMTRTQPASDTFDISMRHQVPIPDAFPSRVSFDQYPLDHTVEDDPSQSWAKKVFQPFTRVRKIKTSNPSGHIVEKEANYPIVFHRDFEYGCMPQADTLRKPSLVKRKPVPSYGGSSLDSQMVPQFPRNRDRPYYDFKRDPYSRYSVGEVIRGDQPEAVYMKQPPSSGFQEGSSAMPKETALGLNLGDYSLMNAASFPSPYVADGKSIHKDFNPLPSSEWSSDTADQAATTPRMPSILSDGNVIPPGLGNVAIKNEQISIVDSAPTGNNVKVAKEYANKKFGEWVSRTSKVSPYLGSHNPSNSNNNLGKSGHEGMKRLEQMNIEITKDENRTFNQNEKESRRTSSKTPVDPFELDVRLSNLTACSPRNSALKRTSHQKRGKDQVSNPNFSRNLAAKMMNERPGKSITGQSGTMLPKKRPSVTARAHDEQGSGDVTPKKNMTMNNINADAICEPDKHDLHTLNLSPMKLNDASAPDHRETIVGLTTADHKTLQSRHWRSTEVLYQNTRIDDATKPFEADRQHNGNEGEKNSTMGDVEPVTISSEELELLNRVQTWRSCVSVTPMRKLYAPSASATEPSTMTGIDQVQTGADERASEWTSISRRVERGLEMAGPVPMLRSSPYDPLHYFDEFNDSRASKSYQMAETRTSMRYMPIPGRQINEEVGDGPGNISLNGPSSELIKFLGSLHLPPAQKIQDNMNESPAKDGLLIDLNPSEIDKQSQPLHFGTQHIRQMSEADSKRLFDLIDDKMCHLPHNQKSEKINESNKTKKTKMNKARFVTTEDMHQTKDQTKEHEAKVWDLLHKTDKDGLTAMERLLNTYAEELGTFAQGNDHAKASLPHAVPQRDFIISEKKQSSQSSKRKSKEVSKPSTSYNTSKTKVDEEKAENVLQSIFEYVQGAGEVSQIHSTLISMHKDLLDRTKDPGQRKSIDDRLMKLEQAVFAKYEK